MGSQLVRNGRLQQEGCTAADTQKGRFPVWVRMCCLRFPLSKCSWTQVALDGTLACVFANVHIHLWFVCGHIGTLLAGLQSALYGHE